jgi:rfaE bifunctional protein nucleotidyltransferase chain/domain
MLLGGENNLGILMNNIVFTNGVFDIIHTGHIKLLKFCKEQGNYLIVAIDSDVRVKSLKGINRPVNIQEDRKYLLESIKYVDEVVIFNSSEELQSLYINKNANIIVKGEEWNSSEELRKLDKIPSNINIKLFPKTNSSTTNIIKKIKEKNIS